MSNKEKEMELMFWTMNIINAGEIEPEAFTLMGASTKRGDENMIGRFGSGLKYAICYLIRNDIEFKIFSGKQEIIFDSVIIVHENVAVTQPGGRFPDMIHQPSCR